MRASEVARRHLWTCAECRAHQRGLRGPSRLRRLASWSPWALAAQLLSGGGKIAVGACCALVIGGGAVTVPVVAEHHRHLPAAIEAATAPIPAIVVPSSQRGHRESLPHGVPVSAPAATVAAAPRSTAPVATTHARRRPAGKPARIAGVAYSEARRMQLFMRVFNHSNPTDEQRAELNQLIREYAKRPVGSREREKALRKVQAAVFRPAKPAPPKGLPAPTPTPVATPIVTPEPTAETPTPTPVPTETATPTSTASPTETPTATVTP